MHGSRLFSALLVVGLAQYCASTCAHEPTLYFADSTSGTTSIYRANPDGTNASVVLSNVTWGAFDIDDRADTIYFAAPSPIAPSVASIWKANLDGSNRVEVIDRCCYPSHLEVDESNNRGLITYFGGLSFDLSTSSITEYGFRDTVDIEYDQRHQTMFLAVSRYFATSTTDTVYSVTADNTITPIVTGIREINGLGIDPVNGYVYFSARPFAENLPHAIYRARTDGSELVRLIDRSAAGASFPTDIEVVPELNYLYWQDLDGIWRSDLNGSNILKINSMGVYYGNIKFAFAVPEPASCLLFALGLMVRVRWRR